ncbi:hypothetical protein HDV05_002120, partial [Chytridiales sp. JEL 0842]
AQTFESCFTFWMGDLATSLSVLDNNYQKATFFISPIWAPFAVMLAFRVFFLQNNIPQCRILAESADFYFQNLPKIPATKPYGVMGSCIKTFLSYSEGAFLDACKNYNQVWEYMSPLDHPGYVVVESIVAMSILGWVLTSASTKAPCEEQNAEGTPRGWFDAMEIKDCLNNVRKKARALSKGCRIVLMEWSIRILDALILWIHDKRRQAMKQLVSYTQKRALQDELEKLPAMKGYMYGMIGKFGRGFLGDGGKSGGGGSSAEEYARVATGIFTAMKAEFMLGWVKN